MSELFEVSDAERKVLESTSEGKAFLAKADAAVKMHATKLREAEAKTLAAEEAKRKLEEEFFTPEVLAAIAEKRGGKPTVSSREEVTPENLADLSPAEIATKLRKEYQAELKQVKDEFSKAFTSYARGVQSAFTLAEIEQLEEKHGEAFSKAKDDLIKLSQEDKYRTYRPKELWRELQDRKELAAKREAEAKAKADAEAKKREQESFTENPEGTIAPSAAGEKDSKEDSFDVAFRNTPGAETLATHD